MVCTPARLKNISFSRIKARILSIEYVTRVLVEWSLTPTSQKLNNLKFFIERGESPNEWTTISQDIAPDELYEFIDYTAQLYDLQKTYYYRVKAVEYSPDGTKELQAFYSSIVDCNGEELDLAGLYVVEEHIFKFRQVDGVPVFIYKKKHDGLQCPECWDSVLKRVTKSNCTVCYGTGKVDGYYSPIEGWMDFGQRSDLSGVGQQGVFQPDKVDGIFTNYPAIRIGDLIREIRPNYFWRVNSLTAPEKNRSTLLQQFQMSAVNRSDIEQKLKYPEDKAREMLKEFEARLAQPEF